ncbi:hypothetical protein H9L39_10559 [Fusarium oxysporum f. sp. albedinis]|nr:hypothetical protein H9L39_10559 [Fusarium oxysporum f. sp. albedinis]
MHGVSRYAGEDGGKQASEVKSPARRSTEYSKPIGKRSTSEKYQVQPEPRSRLGSRIASWRGFLWRGGCKGD